MRPPSTVPVWLDDPVPTLPVLEGEVDTDILVVGGGITGVTLAFTLAEQSATVTLIDAGPIAGGASGRNAGFITLSPPEPYRELIALWGRDGARAALATGRRAHVRIRSLVSRLGLECDYRAGGSVRLARGPEEAEDLRAALPELHADGFRVLETRVTDVVPATAATSFTAAFVTPEDGEIHPARFVRGVALAAVQRGARLFQHSALVGARWTTGLWEVRTPAGLIRARSLVLATNADSARLCPALTPLIAPRRGQMLATAPLPEPIATRPTTALWGYQYWRQLSDGRLIIGGWRDTSLEVEVGFDVEPTAPIQAAIESGLRELAGPDVTVERRWAGTMGFARDGRPLVGWLDAEHHVAICAGFTGHGISLAPACTQELAELLAWKRAPGIATFDPGRFPELRGARERLVVLEPTRE